MCFVHRDHVLSCYYNRVRVKRSKHLTTFRNGRGCGSIFNVSLLFFVFQQEEVVKAEEAKQESAGESPAETAAEVTTPTEGTPASPNTATSPESKETKKKEKVRSIILEYTGR